MSRFPKILLMLLVVLPLLLLGWAGSRLVRHEQRFAKNNLSQLLVGQLTEIDRSIVEQFKQLAAEMQQLTMIDNFDSDELREQSQQDPRVQQLFVINPEDNVIFPPPRGPMTEDERDFLLRAADLFNDRSLQRTEESRPTESTESQTLKKSVQSIKLVGFSKAEAEPVGKWFVWHWGPGIHLIYWQRRPSGHIVGVALERSRWIADVIAQLPDTPVLIDKQATGSRIQIVESGADVIYKWGTYQPSDAATPLAETRLSAPLSAWQIQTYVPVDLVIGNRNSIWILYTGLFLSGLALIALALTVDHLYGLQLREAARRVSFVNQVSHELRTPLTNIRMYAELLENDLDSLEDDDDKTHTRLNVILGESQRLSRLIGNVLTFARQERETLQLCPKEIVVDDILQKVLDSFRPALEQKKFDVELDLYAAQAARIDPDMLEQIVGNLISNVEKYAADGKWMRVTSTQTDGNVTVSVADRGPGISPKDQSRVFAPFWRASNELSQSAGTGIGLTIVQHLARIHGGDVTAKSLDQGVEFVVTLKTDVEEF